MSQEPTSSAGPDLHEYIAILARRKWTAIAITALVVATAVFL
ncbi:MAG: hypothetical protein WD276_05470 [Actinomycetota bacterium]